MRMRMIRIISLVRRNVAGGGAYAWVATAVSLPGWTTR